MRLFACFFLLIFTACLSFAGVGSEVETWLGDVRTSVTEPYHKKLGERGYVFGGRFSMRFDTGGVIQPFSVSPPRYKVGCGAIDIVMGSFSYLKLEYLVDKLQQIMNNADAFAFQLALQTFAPQIENIIAKLEAIADAVNNLNLNSCQAMKEVTHIAAAGFRSWLNESKAEETKENTQQGTHPFWEGAKNEFAKSTYLNNVYDQFKETWQNVQELGNLLRGMFGGNTPANENELYQLLNGLKENGIFDSTILANLRNNNIIGSVGHYTQPDDLLIKSALIGNRTILGTLGSDNYVYSSKEEFLTAVVTELREKVSERMGGTFSGIFSGGGSVDYSAVSSYLSSNPVQISFTLDNGSVISIDITQIVRDIFSYYYVVKRDGNALTSVNVSNLYYLGKVPGFALVRNAALLDDPGLLAVTSENMTGYLVAQGVEAAITARLEEGCRELEEAMNYVYRLLTDQTKKEEAEKLLGIKARDILEGMQLVRLACNEARRDIREHFQALYEDYKKDINSIEANLRRSEEELKQKFAERGLDRLYMRVLGR